LGDVFASSVGILAIPFGEDKEVLLIESREPKLHMTQTKSACADCLAARGLLGGHKRMS